MAKPQNNQLEKVSIRIFVGDREELERFYPALGYNKVVRFLIHKHVKKLQEQENKANGSIDTESPELDL